MKNTYIYIYQPNCPSWSLANQWFVHCNPQSSEIMTKNMKHINTQVLPTLPEYLR